MILIDAGPLVAIANRREPAHASCVDAMRELSPPMLTTWPIFTEAVLLVGRVAGWQLQQKLWTLVVDGLVEIDSGDSNLPRMMQIMERYRDVPMDLGDASLVTLAEERGLNLIFTLDRDFYVYRLFGRQHFTVIPS